LVVLRELSEKTKQSKPVAIFNFLNSRCEFNSRHLHFFAPLELRSAQHFINKEEVLSEALCEGEPRLRSARTYEKISWQQN